jgi:hypothetical protein
MVRCETTFLCMCMYVVNGGGLTLLAHSLAYGERKLEPRSESIFTGAMDDAI